MSKEIPYNPAPIHTDRIFCTSCGQKIREDFIFCTECGSSVRPTQQLPTVMPYQPLPRKRKYGTRVAGAILLSLGFLLLVFGVYLYFMFGGDIVAVSITLMGIGGGLMFLGLVLALIPVKR